ncbi:hypothetical protein [Streptomyces milbemycinicus]|uniref:Uncharacterized protein n=1 Tax=Streptomyces milbemycinicus TaxID=476552 RepID=A0ABW8M2W1_9ACTN
MTDDLSADPGPAPRPGGRDELRAPAAPCRLNADEPMLTAPGLPGTFRLQLFTAAGARPVAVATQIVGEEGMGPMNAAERYASAVREPQCPDQDVPPVWVERQLWPQGSRPGPGRRRGRHRPRSPLPAAPRRGGTAPGVQGVRGGSPRPARPFREPGCMPAGVSWWRRWLRQVLPRRGARLCC